MKTVFQEVGEAKITAIITQFYEQAFDDPIIGHLFFGKDHAQILEGQLAFTIGMLGGADTYRGASIYRVHKHLKIKTAHFNRRLVMLQELFAQHAVPPSAQDEWLAKENRFRQAVIGKKAKMRKKHSR